LDQRQNGFIIEDMDCRPLKASHPLLSGNIDSSYAEGFNVRAKTVCTSACLATCSRNQ
jgi:hypothetical protein